MDNIENLTKLLERIKETSGPDMVLEEDIYRSFHQYPLRKGYPPYTVDIGACYALYKAVFPGFKFSVEESNGKSWAYIGNTDVYSVYEGADICRAALAAMVHVRLKTLKGQYG